jgi:hypothetical protein
MFDPEYDLLLTEWRHGTHIHRATVHRELTHGPSPIRQRMAATLHALANSVEPSDLDRVAPPLPRKSGEGAGA